MRALAEEFLLRQFYIGDGCFGGLLLCCECKTVLFALLALGWRRCCHFGT